MNWHARNVGHMDAAPSEELRRVSPRRRCLRCGSYLSTSNTERLCFPCQRAEFEALWTSGPARRGRSFANRAQATLEGA
jgi:hypothetical protein